jgi:hypothetical protein
MAVLRRHLLLALPFLVSCDAWRLESDARTKCEQGLALVRKAAGKNRAAMSETDRVRTLEALNAGRKLLLDGMGSYVKANEKTGRTYETRTYQEALIVARKLILELRD